MNGTGLRLQQMAVRLKIVAIGYWFLPAPRDEIKHPAERVGCIGGCPRSCATD